MKRFLFACMLGSLLVSCGSTQSYTRDYSPASTTSGLPSGQPTKQLAQDSTQPAAPAQIHSFNMSRAYGLFGDKGFERGIRLNAERRCGTQYQEISRRAGKRRVINSVTYDEYQITIRCT